MSNRTRSPAVSLLAAVVTMASVAIAAVTGGGWRISSVQCHASRSAVVKAAMSGVHHSPSSGITVYRTPVP